MKLTQKECLNPPSKRYELLEWSFVYDLREFFSTAEDHPSLGRSNVDICRDLEECGVITDKEMVDSEYCCTFIYFECKEDAVAFLKRLNAVPEIKYY